MKKFLNIVVMVGLGLVFWGIILYLFQSILSPYAPYFILSGLGCLVIYFWGNFGQIKRFFAQRSAKWGANTALMILLLLAIISLVEIISYRNNKRWDLTENKRFTLSPQTKKILQDLKQDIQVTAFFRPGEPGREKLKDLLQQYDNVSNYFKYEFVDPDRNPVKAQRYKITTYGTIVVEGRGKEEKIYSIEEEDITNAILKVSREGKKIIYFLTGHGEPGINDQGKDGYSNIKKSIEEQNYEVKDLLLMRKEKVPDDAAVLIINGPKTDLLPEEITRVEDYLAQGGRVLCLIDPFSAPALTKLLAKYGVIIGKDVIIDRMSRIFGADYTMPVVSGYENHAITKDFNVASFFPVACSITPKPDRAKGIEAQSLARTSRDSWAETNKALLDKGKATYDEGQDLRGPVSVAVVATIEMKNTKNKTAETKTKAGEAKENKVDNEEESNNKKPPKARLVVYGDSDFAKNAYIYISGNRDLFLNTVSWLAEEEDLISIRPKPPRSVPVFLTATQAKLIFWFPVVLLPATVLIIGISVLYQRRRLAS
jgi:ABC-type uncharacterized transport system involved in gliding motility auxiliary subunit